jgi:hypothetical protein
MTGPLCPISVYGSPVALLKFQMATQTFTLDVLWLQEGVQICMSWVKPELHNHKKMWAEVSSSVPHLLHNGLSDSPSRWKCLLRLLRPVRRPVTSLDYMKTTVQFLIAGDVNSPQTNFCATFTIFTLLIVTCSSALERESFVAAP